MSKYDLDPYTEYIQPSNVYDDDKQRPHNIGYTQKYCRTCGMFPMVDKKIGLCDECVK